MTVNQIDVFTQALIHAAFNNLPDTVAAQAVDTVLSSPTLGAIVTAKAGGPASKAVAIAAWYIHKPTPVPELVRELGIGEDGNLQ